MKTVRSNSNKNLRMILIIAAVTAVALGGLLLLISGNEDRNSVPLDPTETEETTSAAAEQQTQTSQSTTQTETQAASKAAQTLFAAKVESISDSAAVAKLLETIDLKKNVASYKVELQTKDTPKSMNIRFDKTVAEADKDKFDKEMQKYAEQILALVPDAQEVQWTYMLKKGGKSEEVTVFLNEQQAEDLLMKDVKSYGESPQALDILFNQQKGK